MNRAQLYCTTYLEIDSFDNYRERRNENNSFRERIKIVTVNGYLNGVKIGLGGNQDGDGWNFGRLGHAMGIHKLLVSIVRNLQ